MRRAKGTSRKSVPAWTPPPMAVFIAGSGRSGSNLLCAAMDNTGILGHPREWLNLREMRRSHPDRVSDVSDCCRMMLMYGMTSNGIAATKLLANHYTRLEGQFVAREWFPTQSWVHLRRKDRLGQAISRTIAVQSSRWAAVAGASSAARTVGYSRKQIEANLAQIDQADKLWAAYFEAERIQPLTVWYEDLERDLHEAVMQTASHVGGRALTDALRSTPPFATGAFDIKLVRQRNTTNAEWRIRYTLGE